MEILKTFFYFWKRNFLSSKKAKTKQKAKKAKAKKHILKKFLTFEEMELSYFLRVPKNKFIHSSS